ncbi:MAG: sporulation transcriptional regulator SpoIIID [Clostridia bacterium]|nr:sporulation transcriptional regulator SpoIIID [Clostridia bacterium]
MKGAYEERAIELGEYIIKSGATVRATAKAWGISKSTVPAPQSGCRRTPAY